MSSYSEPNLAGLAGDVFPSSKRTLQFDGTLKPTVSIAVPTSPASTGVPGSAPLTPGVSPAGGTLQEDDQGWLAKHLEGLRSDTEASRLDLEPPPAFLAAPRGHGRGGTEKEEDPVHLKSQVGALQADVKALLDQSECWRHRCLQLERDRAVAMAAEDRAQLELRGAHERERHLAARSLEFRFVMQDADNATTILEAEKQKHMNELREKESQLEVVRAALTDVLAKGASQRHQHEVQLDGAHSEARQALERSQELGEALRAKEAELESARAVLRGARAAARQHEEAIDAKTLEASVLRTELREALGSGLAKGEALDGERRRAAELHAHVQNLEAALSAAAARQSSAMEEALEQKTAESGALRAELCQALSDGMSRREALDGERKRAADLNAQVRSLEGALSVASAKQTIAVQEVRDAKAAELAALRSELREALGDSAAKREALSGERTRAAELQEKVRLLEGALGSAAARQAKVVQDALDSKVAELIAARAELREALGDGLAKREALSDERRRNDELRAEVQTLQAALAGAMAKQSVAVQQAVEAKVAELAALRAELREALGDGLLKREAQCLAMVSEALNEEKTRSRDLQAQLRKLEATLSSATSRHTEALQEARLDRERELSAARAEIREMLSDNVSKRESLTEERKKVRELEARVLSLEASLSNSFAKQGELHREIAAATNASKQGSVTQLALEEERHKNGVLRARIADLEVSLKAATNREAEMGREAEVLRTRGDHQEMVSHKLRLDLQDAMSVATSVPSSPHKDRSLITELRDRALTPGGPPLTARTARVDVAALAPPVLPFGVAASTRLDYPRSSVSRRLRKEVLSARIADRTSALSRYDSKGHLISYDAQGRVI